MAVPQPLNQYDGAESCGNLAVSPDPSAFPTCWGVKLLFQNRYSLMTVNSIPVVGIKPDDSSVVIGYQFDEFIHTSLAEHFAL